MKFPSIKDVAHDLRQTNRYVRTLPDTDARDLPDGEDGDYCDIRLQVYPDGQWSLHSGDSSYDQDHRGFWGSSSLDGRRFDSRAMARDLIDQCRDHYAQSTDSEGK